MAIHHGSKFAIGLRHFGGGLLALTLAISCPFHARAEEHGHEKEKGEAAGHAEDEHHDEAKLSPEAITFYGVTVEPVRKQDLSSIFTATARVSFNLEAMAHIGTSVEGRVSEIKVRLGDAVKRGDVLLVVESPALGEAQSDLLQKRTAVEIAQTGVEVTQTAYERAKKLVEGKGLSQAELLKREGEFKSAKGMLLGAQAAATAAENKLHLYGMDQARVKKLMETGEISAKYSIQAPISGQVIEREATLGEVVRPDSEPLMVLADVATLWVLADVPEARFSGVAVGSPAHIRLADIKGEAVSGKVAYASPKIDDASRTGRVRIEVAGGGGLKPGMFAQVELSEAAKPGAPVTEVLAIPESALQTVEGGPAVFVPVEGEANTFAKRAVTVGPAIGNWIPVLSGLKEGEKIVSAGSFILKAELGKAGAAHED